MILLLTSLLVARPLVAVVSILKATAVHLRMTLGALARRSRVATAVGAIALGSAAHLGVGAAVGVVGTRPGGGNRVVAASVHGLDAGTHF